MDTIGALKLIRQAIDNLGVKGQVSICPVLTADSRWIVEVDGKYFGIFDAVRCTFVD